MTDPTSPSLFKKVDRCRWCKHPAELDEVLDAWRHTEPGWGGPRASTRANGLPLTNFGYMCHSHMGIERVEPTKSIQPDEPLLLKAEDVIALPPVPSPYGAALEVL